MSSSLRFLVPVLLHALRFSAGDNVVRLLLVQVQEAAAMGCWLSFGAGSELP